VSETARLPHSTSCVPIGTEWVVARPTPSRLRSSKMMRRSSPASRSFVLARYRALRALHLDPACGRRESLTRSSVQLPPLLTPDLLMGGRGSRLPRFRPGPVGRRPYRTTRVGIIRSYSRSRVIPSGSIWSQPAADGVAGRLEIHPSSSDLRPPRTVARPPLSSQICRRKALAER